MRLALRALRAQPELTVLTGLQVLLAQAQLALPDLPALRAQPELTVLTGLQVLLAQAQLALPDLPAQLAL